jgi:hypothetical protein
MIISTTVLAYAHASTGRVSYTTINSQHEAFYTLSKLAAKEGCSQTPSTPKTPTGRPQFGLRSLGPVDYSTMRVKKSRFPALSSSLRQLNSATLLENRGFLFQSSELSTAANEKIIFRALLA